MSRRAENPRKRPPSEKWSGSAFGMMVIPDQERYPLHRLRFSSEYIKSFVCRPHDNIPINWSGQIQSGTVQTSSITNGGTTVTTTTGSGPVPPIAQQICYSPSYFPIAVRNCLLCQVQTLYPNPQGLYYQYNIAWALKTGFVPDYYFKLAGGGFQQLFNPVACYDAFPADFNQGQNFAHPHYRLRYWPLTGKVAENERFFHVTGCKNPANQAAIVISFFIRTIANGNIVPCVDATTPTGKICVWQYKGGNKIPAGVLNLGNGATNYTTNSNNTVGFQVLNSGHYNVEFLIGNSPADNTTTELVATVSLCSATAKCQGTPVAAGIALWGVYPSGGSLVAAATNTGQAAQVIAQIECKDLDVVQQQIRRARTYTTKLDIWSPAAKEHNSGTIGGFVLQPKQSATPFLLGNITNLYEDDPNICWPLMFGVAMLATRSGDSWKEYKEPFIIGDNTAASTFEKIDDEGAPWSVVILDAGTSSAAQADILWWSVIDLVIPLSIFPSFFPDLSIDQTQKVVTQTEVYPPFTPSMNCNSEHLLKQMLEWGG